MGRAKGSLNKNYKELKTEENEGVSMSDTQVLENIETELDKARVELENTKRQLEEKKKELESLPRREYSKEEIQISEKQVSTQSKGNAAKEKIEALKQYDNQMVTGKFINRRAPGQSVKLTYYKYEGDPVKWWNFEDGKTYTIPRGFADQLNEHYYTPHFVQKQGDMDPNKPASAIHDVDTSNKKYAFVPVGF